MNNAENTQVKKNNAFDNYLGGVGLAITAHGQFISDLRIKHPIFGMIATPYYMYYSTMIAPFTGFIYRENYEEYVAAFEKDEKTDVEHMPAVSLVRTYEDEEWKKHSRQTPEPKATKKLGVTALVMGGLMLLGSILAIGSSED